MHIRKITISDKAWIENLFNREWGSTRIVTRGKLHNVNNLPGFIAELNNEKVGLITYRITENEFEITSLNSMLPGLGIGKTLLAEAIQIARNKCCYRCWLITTNDNIYAQKFYEHLNWKLIKIHNNAIEQSRKIKPEIPLTGLNNVPIRDEYEYEITLRKV